MDINDTFMHKILPLVAIACGFLAAFYLQILVLTMVFAGITCGVMFNIGLGRKITNLGGWVGGAIVGLLMYII